MEPNGLWNAVFQIVGGGGGGGGGGMSLSCIHNSSGVSFNDSVVM